MRDRDHHKSVKKSHKDRHHHSRSNRRSSSDSDDSPRWKRRRSSSSEISYDESFFDIIPAVVLTGLPPNTQKHDVVKSMTNYKITFKNFSLEADGHAYIEFFHHSDATRFLKMTKGFLDISGNRVSLRLMKYQDYDHFNTLRTNPSWIIEAEACNVLILRGLSTETTEDDIRNAVFNLSNKTIYDVRLVKDKISNISRGFCFVELGSKEDAIDLLKHIKTMQPQFTIHQRRIVAGFAKNNFGFSCNAKATANSVASNAIAAGKAANQALPIHLQDQVVQPNNPYQSVIPGDPRSYVFDQASGYYYDPLSALYYDMNIGTYYNAQTQEFLYFDYASRSLIPFAKNNSQRDSSEAKPEDASAKKEVPKPPLKESDKVALDMDKWAKNINKSCASKAQEKKKNIQILKDTHQRAAALSDQIEAKKLYNQLSTTTVKSDDTTEKRLLDEALEKDPHISLNDFVCLLCKRKFNNKPMLVKHVASSKLHMENLQKASGQS